MKGSWNERQKVLVLPQRQHLFVYNDAFVLHLKLDNIMNKTVVPSMITTIMKKYKDILILLLLKKKIFFLSPVTLRSSSSPLGQLTFTRHFQRFQKDILNRDSKKRFALGLSLLSSRFYTQQIIFREKIKDVSENVFFR